VTTRLHSELIYTRDGERLCQDTYRGGPRSGSRLHHECFEASAALPTDIAGILAHADPMQALIDLMGFDTKPSFMWGGDMSGAADSVEIGGSGFDLVQTSIDTEQTSAVLGAGNFSVINHDNDRLVNTADAGLQVGAGAFACLWVGNIVATDNGRGAFGDHDGTTGWALTLGATNYSFRLTDGVTSLVVNAGARSTGAHTLLGVRHNTDDKVYFHTDAASGELAQGTLGDVDPATQELGFGSSTASPSNAMDSEVGIGALWLPAASPESLADSHRAALHTALGF